MANLGDKKRHFLGTTLNMRLNDGREVDKQRQRELFYSHLIFDNGAKRIQWGK